MNQLTAVVSVHSLTDFNIVAARTNLSCTGASGPGFSDRVASCAQFLQV